MRPSRTTFRALEKTEGFFDCSKSGSGRSWSPPSFFVLGKTGGPGDLPPLLKARRAFKSGGGSPGPQCFDYVFSKKTHNRSTNVFPRKQKKRVVYGTLGLKKSLWLN